MNDASTLTGISTLVLATLLAGVPGCGRAVGPDAERGRELLAQYQCGACHAIPGVRNARGRTGPTLERFGTRAYIAGEVPVTPRTLQAWLVDPPALVPDTLMPAMGVSADDAAAMSTYLLSLR